MRSSYLIYAVYGDNLVFVICRVTGFLIGVINRQNLRDDDIQQGKHGANENYED